MREIKFRAWYREEKKMFDVDRIDLTQELAWEEDPKSGEPIVFNELELMQYTGLKDKNGKEIYEGDIVRSYAEEKFAQKSCFNVVYFRESRAKWGLAQTRYYKDFLSGLDFDWGGWISHTIIGNIYENPELLESEN